MSHFYHPDTGYLLHQVEYADPKRKGQYRDATLADARKIGYLPSVTTILQLLSRPGLVIWQLEQVTKAAWDLQEDTMEQSYKDWSSRVIRQSKDYTEWTANFGSAVHFWVNRKLRAVESIEIPPLIPGAEEVADGLIEWFPVNGYEFTHTEHRFHRKDLGYGGSIDLIGTHNSVPCIVDIKTQEPPLTPYLEHSLQLAGYDYALEPALCHYCILETTPEDTCWMLNKPCLAPPPRERISLIANRLNPGEVHQHLWVDKNSTVEQTNARYDKIWLGLVELWMGINQYNPRTSNA